jgi:hypothetical protein
MDQGQGRAVCELQGGSGQRVRLLAPGIGGAMGHGLGLRAQNIWFVDFMGTLFVARPFLYLTSGGAASSICSILFYFLKKEKKNRIGER